MKTTAGLQASSPNAIVSSCMSAARWRCHGDESDAGMNTGDVVEVELALGYEHVHTSSSTTTLSRR